ncbi:MAG: aspartyl/asparaginyl beta-hydroxylase domain-containing protein [Prochloraceae cyanobacterium]
MRMKPGELWWFDNKKPHEAINEADDWRIHLIFDVLNNCYQ